VAISIRTTKERITMFPFFIAISPSAPFVVNELVARALLLKGSRGLQNHLNDSTHAVRNSALTTGSGLFIGSGERYLPTRMVESEPMTPKTLNSQRITQMTTTIFKMLLILRSIGI
jgi:hypothetical protein